MAIKSPKQKGSGGEYEIIALLAMWGKQVGVDLTLTRNLLQTREGGADIDGVTGLEIEVKRVEGTGIDAWWRQVCKAAAKTGNIPMLCHRKNRQPWRFRTRTTVALHNDRTGAWALPEVDVDLELMQAKKWFQHYVKLF